MIVGNTFGQSQMYIKREFSNLNTSRKSFQENHTARIQIINDALDNLQNSAYANTDSCAQLEKINAILDGL